MPSILRRAHLPSLLAGAYLTLVFLAAAAPRETNTVIEAIGLSLLAVALLAMAVATAGFLGRDLKITGIAAEAVTGLIVWGLLNNSLLAAGIYVAICQALALASCIFIRCGWPKPESKSRPTPPRDTGLVGIAAG